jgi:hypothetical protein
MQNYVNQLLADMVAAKSNLPADIDYKLLYPDHPAYKFGLDYIVEWEMAPSYTMDELFRIKAEQLPPAEKLTDEQIVQLLAGIYDLWQAFNYSPDSEFDAPPRVFYTVIKNYWATQSIQYEKYTFIELDFCSYNNDMCVWGDYCRCKDEVFETMEDYKSKVDFELEKGIVHHPNGGISWLNPTLLDGDGNLDLSGLPF